MSIFCLHALWCLLCDFVLPRCVVSLSLSLLLSPFVFVMSVTVSHSSTPPLKAAILSPSLTVCLMFGPSAGLLCFACDTLFFWVCYRCFLHAVLVSLLCCVTVILLPYLVLSLHYLLGYLSSVVPVLSYGTIKVVTFLFDSILKCSSRRLSSSFYVFSTAMDDYCDF